MAHQIGENYGRFTRTSVATCAAMELRCFHTRRGILPIPRDRNQYAFIPVAFPLVTSTANTLHPATYASTTLLPGKAAYFAEP